MSEAALVLRSSDSDDAFDALHIELESVLAVIAEREATLAVLRQELDALTRRLDARLALRYAELDRLEAEIAEILALRHRANERAQQRAREARERATQSRRTAESRRAAETPEPDREPKPFRPSEALKALFRKLARRVHPDGARDDADRERRTRLMADVNTAYREGDRDRLEQILAALDGEVDLADGDRSPKARERLERRLEQARSRAEALERDIAELQASPASQLRAEVDDLKASEDDVLAKLAVDLDARIDRARSRLTALEADAGNAPRP